MGETEENANNRMYQNLGRLLKAAEPFQINSVRRGSYVGEFTFGFSYGGNYSIYFRIGENDISMRYDGNSSQANICEYIRKNLEEIGAKVIETSSDNALERLAAEAIKLSKIAKRLRGEE